MTPEKYLVALETMRSCQIQVNNDLGEKVKRIMPGDNPGITVLVLKELH